MSRPLIPAELAKALRREKYQRAGLFATVKKCHWMHQALVHNRFCYKSKFYGIQSHRCIQMTPSPIHCTQRCRFCWRIQPEDIGIIWDETRMKLWDDPYVIVEKSIEAQRRILTGYKAHPRVSREKFEEAWDPRHAAISLAGEPTLYPQLGELIRAYHKKGMTTFLVTNGTVPNVLGSLDEEPTQLYVSVCAPNKKIHKELCRPQIPNAWEKLNETLEFLSGFKCPTVIRITLVKNYNMCDIEGYARLIERASPTYVEPKAYSHLGYSRLRMSSENVPTHAEVKDFGERLGSLIGYNIIDEFLPSRVVLLSAREKPIRISLS